MSHIDIRMLSDQDATVALVSYPYWNDPQDCWDSYEATGSSKRERGDSYDREIGELLAASRALYKLAAKLDKQARGRMRHLESIRAHREEIKARNARTSAPYAGWSLARFFQEGFPGMSPVAFDFVFPPAPSAEAVMDDRMAAAVAETIMTIVGGFGLPPAILPVTPVTAIGLPAPAVSPEDQAGDELIAKAMAGYDVEVEIDGGEVRDVTPSKVTFKDLVRGTTRTATISENGFVKVYDEGEKEVRAFFL